MTPAGVRHPVTQGPAGFSGVPGPPEGLDYHVAFGADGNFRVSEIWDTQEHLEAFGKRLMPLLADLGIELAGPPEVFEVHNIVKR